MNQQTFLEPIGARRIEPVNGYQVIYADPPWAYAQRTSKDGRKTKFGSGAMGHYPTMTTPEICALTVRQIAAKSALLFMWATFPCLPDALEVIKAWGFQYTTCAFTWVKLNKNQKSFFFGPGYYTKANAEICLLARRGKAIKPATDCESQVIGTDEAATYLSPIMAHSRKPDEARRRIERMYPQCSKVELFARSSFPGWDLWGNQVESTATLSAQLDGQATPGV